MRVPGLRASWLAPSLAPMSGQGRACPNSFISRDETISVSAYQTIYYGGTIAAATAVLAGDRRQADECLP